MLSSREYTNYWRIVALIGLAITLVGPWAYDVIHVPAKYPCEAPFIRLEGDFCGTTLPGITLIALLAGGLLGIVDGFLTGTLTLTILRGEIPVVLLGIIFLLPIFSTLFLLQNKDSPRRRLIQVVGWSLASGAGILLNVSNSSSPSWALWGLWLYIGLAASVAIIEGASLVLMRRLIQT